MCSALRSIGVCLRRRPLRQILSTLCHAAERANPADDPAPDEGGDQWTVARQLASHHQCRARLWSLRAGDNPRLWLWLDVQSWVTISMPLGWQGKVGRIRHCRDSRCPLYHNHSALRSQGQARGSISALGLDSVGSDDRIRRSVLDPLDDCRGGSAGQLWQQ